MKNITVANKEIKVISKDGHYEFFVNGIFYRSCDLGEYTETLEEIKEELNREA